MACSSAVPQFLNRHNHSKNSTVNQNSDIVNYISLTALKVSTKFSEGQTELLIFLFWMTNVSLYVVTCILFVSEFAK